MLLAWTPGTKGPVQAAVVQITLPVRPTKQELSAHLEALREKLKGKIVVGVQILMVICKNFFPSVLYSIELFIVFNLWLKCSNSSLFKSKSSPLNSLIISTPILVFL